MTNENATILTGRFRTTRALSDNGTVVVYPGQLVAPTAVIAYRKAWTRHEAVSISSALGIDPLESVRSYLTIRDGEFISLGETIARREGRKVRTVIAKKSGRFLGLSGNKLIFEFAPVDREQSVAGFPGIVTDILPFRGARLETDGTLIRGVWGNGKFGQGILLAADADRDGGVLSPDSITVDFAGAVVFANTCYDKNALTKAAKVSTGGLIFGSLPADLLPVAEALPFPVILTDRIGGGKISSRIRLALSENIIKFAYLTAMTGRYGSPRKPEIIIPKDEYTPQKNNPGEPLKEGERVRIIDGFYGGEIAIVSQLIASDPDNAEFEQVVLLVDDETELTLPIQNVERIAFDDETDPFE